LSEQPSLWLLFLFGLFLKAIFAFRNKKENIKMEKKAFLKEALLFRVAFVSR
jgi:hypothetical protein